MINVTKAKDLSPDSLMVFSDNEENLIIVDKVNNNIKIYNLINKKINTIQYEEEIYFLQLSKDSKYIIIGYHDCLDNKVDLYSLEYNSIINTFDNIDKIDIAKKLITTHEIKLKNTLGIEVALQDAFAIGVMAGRNNEELYNHCAQYISDTDNANFIKLLCETISTKNSILPVYEEVNK